MKQTNKRPIVLKLVAIVAILHGLLILFAYLLPGYSLLKEVFGYMKVRHSFSNECQLVMNNLTLISVALTLGASLLGLIFIILAVGIWIGKRSSWFNILALYFALYFSSLLVLKSYFNIKVNWAESGVVIFLIVAPLFIEKIKHHCNVGKLREIRNLRFILILFVFYVGLAASAGLLFRNAISLTEKMGQLECKPTNDIKMSFMNSTNRG